MKPEKQILTIINSVLDGIVINDENIDSNLMDLGLDSIKFIRLVIALEDEFCIEIPDSILLLQEMDTPLKIIAIINRLSKQLDNQEEFN